MIIFEDMTSRKSCITDCWGCLGSKTNEVRTRGNTSGILASFLLDGIGLQL